MARLRSLLPILSLLVPPIACGDDGGSPDPDGADDAADDGAGTTGAAMDDGADDGSGDAAETGEPVDPNAPTYYGDILPLVVQHCSGCHVEGGIGPFDLEDYETAEPLAEAMALVTELRTMPPFNANNDGSCNTFKDARWLSDDEIDLIARWVEGGAQEGDPATEPPPRPEPELLAGSDIREHGMPENYQPVADDAGSNGYDDYQCFLVDLGVTDTPRYLVGYEVVPGNATVTHHLVGFLVDPNAPSLLGTNGDQMTLLDNQSPDQPGWDCFGAAGNGIMPEGTPVTWAPGGGAFNFPEGTGIRIDPGYVLVAQMHYNLVNGAETDSTVLRLSWADEVEREAVNALDDRFLATAFNGAGVEIPPNTESFVWTWDGQVRNWDSRIAQWERVEILGLLPHMHEIGNRMQVNFFTGANASEEQCAIYVDRWDFEWQQAFMYETPFLLDPNDSIQVTCEWDSTGRDYATTPGLGTQNEMCLLGIYAAEAQ